VVLLNRPLTFFCVPFFPRLPACKLSLSPQGRGESERDRFTVVAVKKTLHAFKKDLLTSDKSDNKYWQGGRFFDYPVKCGKMLGIWRT